MRIIDLQRRLREIGRIRLGDTTTAANGKIRPRKLTTFRLTSRDRQVIDAAAGLWGGTVTEWAAPDGQQWQVTTQTAEIPVIVPPGDMSFSQSYEQWTAGGCQVRCDGRWDHIADTACHCDPEQRDCNIHSRLSVLVPELPGVGVWRLDTQGYYAAVELNGIVDLCAAQAARGVMLPARLRLEQRSVKRVVKDKVTTLRFAVPVLDLDVHPMSLTAGAPVQGEIGGGFAGELPGSAFSPVPEGAEAMLRPSVADQVAAVDDPSARESRQAPIPSTGLKPRTVDQVNATESAPSDPANGQACSVCGESWKDGRPVRKGGPGESSYVHTEHDGSGPGDTGDREEPDTDTQPADAGGVELDTSPGPSTDAGAPAAAEAGNGGGEARAPAAAPADEAIGWKDVALLAGRVFKADYDAAPTRQKTRTVDRLRHALVYACTDGDTASAKGCTAEQLLKVRNTLDAIGRGEITYRYDLGDDKGVTLVSASGKERTVLWAEAEMADDEQGAMA